MKTMSPRIAAEAAVWIARLHGPDRSPQLERECLAWQAISPQHRLAFERCTDTWLDAAGLQRAPPASPKATAQPSWPSWSSRPSPRRWSWITATATATAPAALAIVALTWLPGPSAHTYRTQPGEQLTVTLQDGSRMTLNTATQVKVAFSSTQRTISVDAGEALFEVAKDPQRRFVVQVAHTEVIAKGTVFAVRYTPTVQAARELVVSLLEGKVEVLRTGQHAQPTSMSAGDRLTLVRPSPAPRAGQGPQPPAIQRDRPPPDQMLAWQHGEALFDNTSLQDAVEEMNRYSKTPITLSNPETIGRLRVSGSYRTGDNRAFARAIAALHQLDLGEHQGQFELAPGSALN